MRYRAEPEADLCPCRCSRHRHPAGIPPGGIGGRLIRQALDAAKAFGLHRVELTVRENNVVAIQLYKKFGFAVEGLQRKQIWSRASTKTWC